MKLVNLENLESTHPKAFWDLCNELSNEIHKSPNTGTSITPEHWWDHFYHTLPHHDVHFNDHIDTFWDDFQNIPHSRLDHEIGIDDVLDAITSLALVLLQRHFL